VLNDVPTWSLALQSCSSRQVDCAIGITSTVLKSVTEYRVLQCDLPSASFAQNVYISHAD
jgi:hypothetical protein